MSIQEHLNKIRNAVYGHEVRESIAKGIETAYDDAIEKDNANMEVKIARGTHPNLRSRLEEVDNKQQQTTAQLAQKVGGGRLATLNDFDEETLNFIHDGTGGPITVESVPKNNSVTPKKTTYLTVVTENLFNKSDVAIDKIINYETGVLTNREGYMTSGFIEVEPNTLYTFSEKVENRVFYDSNKEIISGTSPATTFITTPINARFIRISPPKYRIDAFMIVKGDTLPNEYFPFGKQLVTYSNNIQFTDDTFQSMLPIPTRSKLYGKKWNALGDSITRGSSTTKPYHEHISEKTGCIVNNYGISNSTVTTVNDGGFEPFVNRYMDMSDDADVITVFGGINDAGYGSLLVMGDIDSTDSSTFYGAYNVLLEGLIKKYPTKLIVTMTPLKADDGVRPKQPEIAYAIKEVSEKYSVPCLDLYSMSGISLVDEQQDLLQPDKLHLNSEGHKIIAGKILSFIENNMPIE